MVMVGGFTHSPHPRCCRSPLAQGTVTWESRPGAPPPPLPPPPPDQLLAWAAGCWVRTQALEQESSAAWPVTRSESLLWETKGFVKPLT